MLQVGELLNKSIPMEMLVQMPLPFVHRLRDLKIKQLIEQNKQRQESANTFNTNNNVCGPPLTNAVIDEFMENIENL